MRRLGHTAILLGFSAPVACAAGVVAFFALAAAPAPSPVSGRLDQPAEAPIPAPVAALPLPAPELPVQETVPPADIAKTEAEAPAQEPVAPAPEPSPPPPEAAAATPPVSEPAAAAVVEPPPLAAAPPAQVAAQSPAPAAEPPAPPEVKQITIKAGNSLWSISRDIYGSGRHYPTLLNANRGKISDPRLIYPGQVLAAPNKMED